jgi:GDP-6-deoxy-D-talose 4-dehydrogenase
LRILVTGSGGFTGRHFEPMARHRGHEVVALRSDLTDRAAVASEVRQAAPDAVVHLGGISFVAHKDERALYDVNLFGTLNLLDALREARRPLQRVLLASSANVYGNSQNSPIAESERPAPANHYAMSKLAMEHMAATREELPLVIARPFNYTGPGQSPSFVIPKLVDHFRRRAGEVRLGNLHVEREYNDVRFVCEAYLRLLEAPRPAGPVNVCSGATHSFQHVLALLKELTGHDIDVQVDPEFVRPNEIHRLCGDPSYLLASCGELPAYTLRDTLAWMLASAD